MKKITVVKFGGSLTKNKNAQKHFIAELACLSKKENIILVHGGGPEINMLLEKLSITSKFVNGLRYTDEKTLEVVEMALSGKVNKMLTAELIKKKIQAVGISAKDGSTAVCSVIKELGFVGNPVKINRTLLEVLLKNGFLPVVSSVGIDKKANTVNINADSLATALAVAFRADKLVLLTDVAGVLDNAKKTIKEIKIKNIAGLIKSNVITGGMIPKINGCKSAVLKGVKNVFIIDGAAGIKKMKGTVIKK